jgi:hypothetical protein
MALLKGNALSDQAIQNGRVHIVKAQRCDRVEALLVSNNENDIRLRVTHPKKILIFDLTRASE